jgi:hypothetical protein
MIWSWNCPIESAVMLSFPHLDVVTIHGTGYSEHVPMRSVGRIDPGFQRLRGEETL